MEAPVCMDTQTSHVEQSRRPVLSSYATKVLKRQETKKAMKSIRGSSSQHKSVSRRTDTKKQLAKCPVVKNSAPMTTVKKIRKATSFSNDKAYQQLEKIVLQRSIIDHAIPVNVILQNMPVSSHMSNMTNFTAMEDSNPYATRENDGQGMDEASFQKILAGLQTGLQIISGSNNLRTTSDTADLGMTFYENYNGRGIVTRYDRSAYSQISSYEKRNNLSSCLGSMRSEDDISLEQAFTDANFKAANGIADTTPKIPKLGEKGGKKSPKLGSNAIADGVFKKGKPTKKVGSFKKKDIFCPHNGCGKACKHPYNLKVHSRGHNGRMKYTCPKKANGCFLCFGRRSSMRCHLKMVHNVVVPIWHNARETFIPTTANKTTEAVLWHTSANVRAPSGRSFVRKLAFPAPRASTNGRRKKALSRKQAKARMNFSATAIHQLTAQELLQLIASSLSKSSNHTTPTYVPGKSVQGRMGAIAKENSVQLTCCSYPEVEMDLVDIPSYPIHDVEMSIPSGSSKIEEDAFEGMDVDFPDHLAVPMLNGTGPWRLFTKGSDWTGLKSNKWDYN